jgi:predicted nucleotidyltransferase
MQEKNLLIPTTRHAIALWLFSLFPNILLVAICNSRAMGEENKNSDIDLFFIAKS